MKSIRIGAGLGFYGDNWEPIAASIERGGVQFIASDHLAELTLAILQKDRQRDPSLGYARDVVANVKQICEESKVELPDIVSESGRALVAPHSILIFEAVDRITRDDGKVDTSKGKTHQLVKELEAIRKNKRKFDPLERYHDAKEKREEMREMIKGVKKNPILKKEQHKSHPNDPEDGV